MLLLRTLAPWLLVAFLAQQVSPSSGARERGRHNNKEDRGEETVEDRGEERKVSGRGGKAAATRGKFSTKNKMRCTWAAREDGDVVTLGIDCKHEEASRVTRCEYTAKPASCPGYGSNPAGFWKQVARALKKMKDDLCSNHKALVKAGMCKRAPRDAHFKLDTGSAAASPAQEPDDRMRQPETPGTRTPSSAITRPTAAVLAPGRPATTGRSCTERADQRELAEEYCSSSWASLCTFFFTMVQGADQC
ncbi:fibroblast growth factor-binding protein 1-like [Diretmus argenteus]